MSDKKEKKTRPEKYEPKVAIKANFEQAMGMFADHANKKVKDSQKKPNQ